MRILVVGLGAVGGVIAAGLALSGQAVAAVARGAQLAAVQENGLTWRSPGGTQVARFPCAARLADLAPGPDDAILLAVKTQDTAAALAEMAAAGVRDQPVFCFQNGVANERLALAACANVHAVTVLMPCEYLVPGEVATFWQPVPGAFDLGRAPAGRDAADHAMADALIRAGFEAQATDAPMPRKYGKLLGNLGNIAVAALGPGPAAEAVTAALRAEGIAVLAAAGIAWTDPMTGRGHLPAGAAGARRVVGSTAQSLARGTGSVETDFLNGEILRLAEATGTPAPLNARALAVSRQMLADHSAPASLGPEVFGV